MNKTVAALTLALAGTFAASAADAHGYGHHDHHRGRGFEVIIQPPQYYPQERYYAPPPQYYAPPPAVYVPAPEISCTPRFDRNGYEIGSDREYQDPNTGNISRPLFSRQLCPY